MAWILLRAAPDVDQYAAYSTISDQFFWFGTLAEAQTELEQLGEGSFTNNDGYFQRAHDTGTSSPVRGRWAFSEREHDSHWRVVARDHFVQLPSANLAPFVAEVLNGIDPDEALLRRSEPDVLEDEGA